MAEKQTNKERLKDITDSIETESGLCVFHFEEASLRPLSE